MNLLFLRIIQFLIVYLPLEDTFLRIANFPPILFAFFKGFAEGVTYLLVFLVVVLRLASGKKLVRTGLEAPFLLFIAGVAIAIFTNDAAVFDSLMSVRPLLRFVLLTFLLAQLTITSEDLRLIFKLLVGSAVFQCVFSIMQVVIPSMDSYIRDLRASFSVVVAGIEKGGYVAKIGSATGTFTHASNAALFLCLVAAITLASRYTKGSWKGVWNLITLALIACAVFLTYKRYPYILFSVMSISVVFLYTGWVSREKIVIFAIILLPFLLVKIKDNFNEASVLSQENAPQQISGKMLRTKGVRDVSYYMTEVFRADYWKRRFSHSRGKVIGKLGPELLLNFNFFGFSPDNSTAKKNFVKKSKNVAWLLDYKPLEDVYWVAMFLYYGPWGVMLWLYMLFRVFRCGSELNDLKNQPVDITLGRTIKIVVFLAIFSACAARSFELRGLSFYFWMLAGLTISRIHLIRLEADSNGEQKPVIINSPGLESKS